MLSTGEFSDPETRLPFSDKDLEEIDNLAKKLRLKKGSVLEAKGDPRRYEESKFRRDALLGLERCAGNVISDILKTIETYEPEEAQMQILVNQFPLFSDYFQQMMDVDPAYTKACGAQWRSYLIGPPNRPNEDPFGMLECVSEYLNHCEGM